MPTLLAAALEAGRRGEGWASPLLTLLRFCVSCYSVGGQGGQIILQPAIESSESHSSASTHWHWPPTYPECICTNQALPTTTTTSRNLPISIIHPFPQPSMTNRLRPRLRPPTAASWHRQRSRRKSKSKKGLLCSGRPPRRHGITRRH